MKTYFPLIAVFASTLAYAQLADSTGAGRLHMSPPIASEGGSCNTSEVKSDANGNILYCQSGIWKKTQGDGRGMSGIWGKYKGMSATCSILYDASFTASVDENSNLRMQIKHRNGVIVKQCANATVCAHTAGSETYRLTFDTFSIHGTTGSFSDSSNYGGSCSAFFPVF